MSLNLRGLRPPEVLFKGCKMITIDGAYKTIDGVLVQLQLTREQHVQLQNNLRFLYDVAKEAQESKEVEKDG